MFYAQEHFDFVGLLPVRAGEIVGYEMESLKVAPLGQMLNDSQNVGSFSHFNLIREKIGHKTVSATGIEHTYCRCFGYWITDDTAVMIQFL